jgi:hypothetical protein
MRWLLVSVTAAYGGGALVMCGWLLPLVASVCGEPPLDGRFLWSASDAMSFAGACGAPGLAAYRQLQLADLIYPALLGSVVIGWALHWAGPGWGRVVVVALAGLNVVADYTENLGAWTVLVGHVDAPLLVIMPVVTTIKNLSGTAAFVGLAVLAMGAIRRWFRRRKQNVALA